MSSFSVIIERDPDDNYIDMLPEFATEKEEQKEIFELPATEMAQLYDRFDAFEEHFRERIIQLDPLVIDSNQKMVLLEDLNFSKVG
jgi:hypothetical protein